jgi:hypothetical protein
MMGGENGEIEGQVHVAYATRGCPRLQWGALLRMVRSSGESRVFCYDPRVKTSLVPVRSILSTKAVGYMLGVIGLLAGPLQMHVLAATLRGQVLDAATHRPIPSRVYIQSDDGRWFFPDSESPQGSAVRYEKRNWVNTNAVECHTTLSAHSFRVDLPPGTYTVTVERGKEYRPLTQRIEIGAEAMAD